jgi:hypothetical protein
MDMVTAEERLRSLLDVSVKRYPTAVAYAHLNQACQALSEETDLWFDRYVISYEYSLPDDTPEDPEQIGSIPLDSLGKREYVFSWLAMSYYRTEDGEWKAIPAWNYQELIETFGDEESEAPTAVAVLGYSLFFRPIPPTGTAFRFEIKGRPAYAESGTNGWLTYGGQAVIYRAAAYAVSYMMEDDRIPVFETLAERELMRVSINASMMSTSEPKYAQEPG